MSVRRVAIVGGVRIPFTKSMTNYMGVSNQELMTHTLKSLVDKFDLKGQLLGEVSVGAVMKHASDWNMARESTLGSGLDPATPAYDVQQACGTSLETSILIANKIRLGQIECGIAGGTDTNSDLPVVFSKKFAHKMLESYKGKTFMERLKPFLSLSPKDLAPIVPAVIEPRTGLSMGQSCEKMAQEWQIPRDEQDVLAYHSHMNAVKAYEEGFYKDLIVPFKGLEKDTFPRKDTTIEKLSTLKPVFDRGPKGTITAGNASPLTDGASAVLLASEEWARARGLPILAYFGDGETAAVDFVNKDGLLMAPVFAVPRLLKRAGLKLQDFDFYEIHEAFAAQVLCTLKAWESDEFCRTRLGLSGALGKIDRSKMNVKGGSIATGHPFAATGTRIVTSLAKMINQKGSGRGLISICTAGGMGVTAIVEK